MEPDGLVGAKTQNRSFGKTQLDLIRLRMWVSAGVCVPIPLGSRIAADLRVVRARRQMMSSSARSDCPSCKVRMRHRHSLAKDLCPRQIFAGRRPAPPRAAAADSFRVFVIDEKGAFATILLLLHERSTKSTNSTITR